VNEACELDISEVFMNRIDRLFAILLILQKHHHKPITAATIANRFSVSERTIYRDMQALMEIGVPIIASPSDGYKLMDTFHLSPVMLSSAEAMALFLGGWMLKRHAEGAIVVDVEVALQKIEAILPPESQNYVNQLAHIIDFYPLQNRLNLDEPHLMTILEAIQTYRVIHIAYRAYMDEHETERDIEPYRLTFSEGAWYVNGFCLLRHDIRNFRLNRITQLQMTDTVFQKRMIVAESVMVIQVVVRFSDQIMPHIRENQHYGFLAEQADNIIVYEVHTLSEIQNWLFGFGAQAEVIAPIELRQWVHDEAKRLINILT
jgi:predicted DNA-binding transcriptional regulator YafY